MAIVSLLLVFATADLICEQGVDHPYGDLPGQPITLPEPKPELCKQLCDQNRDCKVWSYVKPGCYSPEEPPWCYLKGQELPAASNPCVCSSKKVGPLPPPPVPPGPVLYTLKSGGISYGLDRRGIVSISSGNASFSVSGDAFGIEIEDQVVWSNALDTPQSAQTAPTTVRYAYKIGSFLIEVVYEVKDSWKFISKQLFVSSSSAVTFFLGNIEVFQGIIIKEASRSLTEAEAIPTDFGSSAVLLRFRPDLGLFLLAQNPFLHIETNLSANSVRLSYPASMSHSVKQLGTVHASDRGCLGVYRLSDRTYAHHFTPSKYPLGRAHPSLVLTPSRFVSPSPRTTKVDVGERDAVIQCVTAFFLRPHTTSTVKLHIPWCENDYQIDFSNLTQRAQYARILDRLSSFGITHTLFTPQNTDVATRDQCTDSWCWEEVLWNSLGVGIRTNKWVPGRDAIPATVQAATDLAKSKGVKLVPYIYPSLKFEQNPDWVVNGAASLASVGFQDWLVDAIVKFNKATSSAGAGFDYTFFTDNVASPYAQWRGWQRVLFRLRGENPDVMEVIDNRQANHAWGPWMWNAGSYAEPLSTDEQPETWQGVYPVLDPLTDRLAANYLRLQNWRYSNNYFCSPLAMPGFVTHQTDRSDEKGKMYWTDFLLRDFDYLGYRYSLLSSIGTAGLNTVFNMVPARDQEEFDKFPAEDVKWIRDWLAWTDSNIEYLKETKFFLQPPGLNVVDGTYSISNSQGYVFLFNAGSRKLQSPTISLADIGVVKSGNYLVAQLEPTKRNIVVVKAGGNFSIGDLDARSAVVLSIFPAPTDEPLLLGVSGEVQVMDGRLIISVTGQAGTAPDISVHLPASTQMHSVLVNRREYNFHSSVRENGKSVISVEGVQFQGTYTPGNPAIIPFNASFSGGQAQGVFNINEEVLVQLRSRNEKYPIQWNALDLTVPWLAPHRLLAFVDFGQRVEHNIQVTLTVDGRLVDLQRVYNARGTKSAQSFVGHFADLSFLGVGRHNATVTVPSMSPGLFQGVYLETLQPIYTSSLV